MNTKRNIMLNFLKCLACIGVVFIHISFPGKTGEIVKCLCTFAVPIFFLTAGYYAFNKDADTIKRRLIKIVKIFLFAYLVFFLFNAYTALQNSGIKIWLIDNFNVSSLLKYIVVCTVSFAIPLWYLIAQIETYILWIILIKLKKEDVIAKFAPILMILQGTLTTYCETTNPDWPWNYNFITISLSWFTTGYCLHKLSEEHLQKIRNTQILGVALLGLIIVFLPILLHLKVNFSSFGYIIYATSLFVFALKNPDIRISKPLEYIGDKLSLWVYIFHIPTSSVIKIVLQKLLGLDTETGFYTWIHPIITVFAVLLIAYIFNLITTKFSKKQ